MVENFVCAIIVQKPSWKSYRSGNFRFLVFWNVELNTNFKTLMRNTLNAYCSILLFSWLFLCLADSVTTDSMWACFTVLTIDLQTSLTHPTETLQEDKSMMGPLTYRLFHLNP